MVVRNGLLRVSMVLLVLLVAGLIAILLVRAGVERNPGPDPQDATASKDPLQRNDVALSSLAYDHVLDLEQARQLAGTYLGIDKTQITNIVCDDVNYKSHENKIEALLHKWKTQEGDVRAEQLYSYLTQLDLRVSQLEKARNILEIQVNKAEDPPCKPCHIMSICDHWHTDPLDIAAVNRCLFEDIYLVDPNNKTFKTHCATKMSQADVQKFSKDANSLAVELTRFEIVDDEFDFDMLEKLKFVNVIIGHYPHTHKDVLKCSKYNIDAARIFFIHAIDEEDDRIGEFSQELAGSDLVYFLSENLQEEYTDQYFTMLTNGTRTYIPSCPLLLIPTQTAFHGAKSKRKKSSPVTLLTYCSGLSDQPLEDYKLLPLKEDIAKLESHASWKIVTSKDQDVKQEIDKSVGNIKIECHKRTSLLEFYQKDVFKTTYWVVPHETNETMIRTDLLFAVGSGKPFLTNGSSDTILEMLDCFMDTTSGEPIKFASLSEPLDDAVLQENARTLLMQYLHDTKSAESHMEFIQKLIEFIPKCEKRKWAVKIVDTTASEEIKDDDLILYFQRITYLRSKITAKKKKVPTATLR